MLETIIFIVGAYWLLYLNHIAEVEAYEEEQKERAHERSLCDENV